MPRPYEKIASFQNPKIKLVKRLREKRERERSGLFVIDDGRDLARALAYGYEVEYALYCPALGDESPVKTLSPVYEVPREIMEKVSYRENPAPVVAVMKQKAPRDPAEVDAPLILGLVNLRKPGNIGALLRSADATGFRVVFLIDSALDIYNPNIIRSSTGACFLPTIYTLTSAQALAFFRTNGYRVIAAAPDGETSLFAADFTSETAIILGTEDAGLSRFWVETADCRVQIPMVGQMADSLNVSVSGAVIMYEALRQRRN